MVPIVVVCSSQWSLAVDLDEGVERRYRYCVVLLLPPPRPGPAPRRVIVRRWETGLAARTLRPGQPSLDIWGDSGTIGRGWLSEEVTYRIL